MSNEIIQHDGGAMVPADDQGVRYSMPGPTQAAARRAKAVQAPAALADLPADIGLSDDDREIAGSFAKAMTGAPPQFIHQALRWYAQHARRFDAVRDAADAQDRQTARDALRAEWGMGYAANVRAVKQQFATLPIAVQQALENAELDDGTLLLNSESGLRWLFDLARRPMTQQYVPNGGGSIADEIQQIQEIMRTDRRRYNRDEAMQARYRKLLEMRG